MWMRRGDHERLARAGSVPGRRSPRCRLRAGTEVDFTHLAPTNTLTACPYKGTTSGYWTAHLGDTSYSDIAWTYDFPTRQLLPIAGLIAFYNEKVDTFLDGRLLDRPVNLPSR